MCGNIVIKTAVPILLLAVIVVMVQSATTIALSSSSSANASMPSYSPDINNDSSSNDSPSSDATGDLIKAVTYSPFGMGQVADIKQYPTVDIVEKDLNTIKQANINTIKTYDVQPEYVLDLADKIGLKVIMGIWIPHDMDLSSQAQENMMIKKVQQSVILGKKHDSVIMYSIGNELPTELVERFGRSNVERLIHTLYNAAKDTDPNSVITYGNWLPTEYLDLKFLDVVSFNVYLYDKGAFDSFLLYLKAKYPDKPMFVSEFGVDSFRFNEEESDDILRWQWNSILGAGYIGGAIFEYSDEYWKAGNPWFQDPHPEEHWGLVNIDRSPKKSLYAVEEMFQPSSTVQVQKGGMDNITAGKQLILDSQPVLLSMSFIGTAVFGVAKVYATRKENKNTSSNSSKYVRGSSSGLILIFIGLNMIIFIFALENIFRFHPYYAIWTFIFMDLSTVSLKLALPAFLLMIAPTTFLYFYSLRKFSPNISKVRLLFFTFVVLYGICTAILFTTPTLITS